MAIVFSKLLSKTDIKKRLPVPTGGHAVDEAGHTWTFTCNRRKKNHPKPVLSRGWLHFVRNKRLNVGDKVNIYNIEKPVAGGAPFIIQAEKEVKVFGTIFGYAPIGNPGP